MLTYAGSWLDEVPPHVLAIDGALRAITSAIKSRYIGEAEALVTAGDLIQGMRWRTLTYADVCWRMLTYAAVCWRMLTYADAC